MRQNCGPEPQKSEFPETPKNWGLNLNITPNT